MTRRNTVRAASCAVITATFYILVNSACAQFFDPCPNTFGTEDVGQMDGTWYLKTVNGHAVPTPDPTNSVRIIHDAQLNFYSDNFKSNGPKCTDIEKTFGTVYGTAHLIESGVNNTRRGSGRFDKDHPTSKLTIHAAGFQATFPQSGNSFTVSGQDLSLLGFAKGVNITLTFQK